MTEIVHLNTEKARFEPDTAFSRPLDIVSEVGLTRGQKIATLERWNQTLEDKLRATSEGMAPPAGQTADEAATIVEIGKALKLLQHGQADSGDEAVGSRTQPPKSPAVSVL